MAASPRVSEGSELGSYRILRKLGEGGMGAVFEGVHTSIGRHAAVKVLHAEHAVRSDVVQRFFNEARAVNLIDHPALVQIWDFGQSSDGTAYIVMEFLRGESLGKKLKREGALPVTEALDITRQIASALAAVHAQQIVHRDLKPEIISPVETSRLQFPAMSEFRRKKESLRSMAAQLHQGTVGADVGDVAACSRAALFARDVHGSASSYLPNPISISHANPDSSRSAGRFFPTRRLSWRSDGMLRQVLPGRGRDRGSWGCNRC